MLETELHSQRQRPFSEERDLESAKYLVPSLPEDYIPRPGLVSQLNTAFTKRFVLVKSPAGFGKTSIVVEWLNQLQECSSGLKGSAALPVQSAWLSLDSKDNDLRRFVISLIHALKTAIPDLGDGVVRDLDVRPEHEPILVEEIVAFIAAELSQANHSLVIVLDDYQFIESDAVHRCISLLLDQLPSQVTLLITSRVQPQFPMAKIRVKRQLLELNESALRFSRSEIESFVELVVNEKLTQHQLDHLEGNTEGWITGILLICQNIHRYGSIDLQLPSLSDADSFVSEYIIEEIFKQQTSEIQDFLFEVTLFEKFNASFCDYVRGRCDSDLLIRKLSRDSLFLVPLDAEGKWYRFHHLFSEVLQRKFPSFDPYRYTEQKLKNCYLKASDWYEKKGELSAAVEFALLGGDIQKASVIVEDFSELLLADRNIIQLLRWKTELPEAVIVNSPRLIVIYSWAFALSYQIEAADELLRALSHVNDGTIERELHGKIDGLKAYLALSKKNIPAALDHGQQAYLTLPEYCLASRVMCILTLANAYLSQNDDELALHYFNDAIELAELTENAPVICFAEIDAVQAYYQMGQLSKAESHLAKIERVVCGVQRGALEQVRGRSLLWRGIFAYERSERVLAFEYLLKSIAIATEYRDSCVLQGYYALVELYLLEGSIDRATQCLSEVERLVQSWGVPQSLYLARLTALKCRLWIEQNRLDLAGAWLEKLQQAFSFREERGGIDQDVNSCVTLGHVILAFKRDDYQLAQEYLDSLLAQIKLVHSKTMVVRIWLLKAMASFGQQKKNEAYFAIRQAVNVASVERVFVAFHEYRKPLQEIICSMKRSPEYKDTYRTVNGIYQTDGVREYVGEGAMVGQGGSALKIQLQPDGSTENILSGREMKVIELIAQGLSNQSIAEKLFISLHTVKSHARKINVKLDVRSRTQAIARAQALGLLD